MTPSNSSFGSRPAFGLPLPLAARLFLPFAAGFFLSYLFRTVNAVIAPDIVADTGMAAADVGLLTSMYFLSFAAFQLPLGILLDRFGPRRVEAALLMVAACGAVVFAMGNSLAELALGRALIGVGVSCGLMAGFKAFALWFPTERIPVINGLMMAFGGLGALVSTAPVELLLQVTDWRGVFLGLAVGSALLGVLFFVIVPEHHGAVADVRLREQLHGLRRVFRDAFFWRVAPAAAITIGVSLSLQSLWAGPWLRDVQGAGRLAAANHLMVIAASLTISYPVVGSLARRLGRLGIATATIAGTGMSGFIVVVATMSFGAVPFSWALMAVYGFVASFTSLCYASFGQYFPAQLVGRANTAMNVLVFASAFVLQWGLGVIIGHWADPVTGHYQPMGYRVGFGLLAALQVAAMAWFFLRARCGRGQFGD